MKKVKVGSDKVCVICGASASSCNFGAVTCQPCKAFFRRNANKDNLIELCGNDCVINEETRGSCKSCRIKKCFHKGMDKNLIWTPHEREKRKDMVEENRRKRHIVNTVKTSEIPDIEAITEGTKHAPKPAKNLTDIHSFQGALVASLKPKLASESEKAISSPGSDKTGSSLSSEPRQSCSSSASCSTRKSLSIECDNLVPRLHDDLSPECTFSGIFLPKIINKEGPIELEGEEIEPIYKGNGDHSSSNAENIQCDNQRSDIVLHTDSDNLLHKSEDHCTKDETNTIQREKYIGSGRETTFSTDSMFSLTPDEVFQTNTDSTTSSHGSSDSKSHTDDMFPISNPYNVKVHTPSVIRNVNINSSIIKFLKPDMATILQQVTNAFHVSYEKPIVEHIKKNPTLPEVFNQLEGYIRKSVTFAKHLPAFKDLPPSDQLMMVKESFLEVTNVYMMTTFNPSTMSFYITHKLPEDPETVVVTESSMTAMAGMEMGKGLVVEFSEVWQEYSKVTRNDLVIASMIMACMLFTQRPHCSYSCKNVQVHFETLLTVLEKYISINYSKGEVQYSDILEIIQKLRTSADTAKQVLSTAPTQFLSPFVAPFTLDDD